MTLLSRIRKNVSMVSEIICGTRLVILISSKVRLIVKNLRLIVKNLILNEGHRVQSRYKLSTD